MTGSGSALPAAAAALRRDLDAHEGELLAALAEAAATDFLEGCGLDAKLAALQTAAAQPHVAMATVLGLEPLALAAATRSFYAALFRSGGAPLPRAAQIASAELRGRAVTLAARTLAATHRQLHEMVSAPGSGYDKPETILLHSAEEVETLLDVGPAASK